MSEVIALAAVLLAPAAVLLGLLAVIGLVVIGLADPDTGDGRLLRPRSADPRP